MAKVEGLLLVEEKVENKERTFGSCEEYFPCYIELENGTKIPALFTRGQIDVATDRARRNEEDIEAPKESFLGSIFG